MYNKLTKPFWNRTPVLVIFFISVCLGAEAQDSTGRKPEVMSSWNDYHTAITRDTSGKMIDLKKLIPSLVLDLRYASRNNFMKRQMYDPAPATTFLRAPAAKALLAIQLELAETDLGLKVFDAYRPYSVTVKFWELVKDERYVANPAKGSGHNRGIAIDLTLIRLSDHTELPMGTGFDNFSDTAHHSFPALPMEMLKNRRLLRSVMEKHGFKALDTEWWHYFLPGANSFELLDIPFRQLQRHY